MKQGFERVFIERRRGRRVLREMKQNHVGCGDSERTKGVLEVSVHKGMQVLTLLGIALQLLLSS